MKTTTLSILLSSVLLATSAFAQKSTIEGNATGADGKALKNAQVRIQPEKSKSAAVMVKTDAKGHFVATGLPVGSYEVVLLAGNAIQSSVPHVKTKADARVSVNLAARQAPAASAVAAPKKERSVWIPPSTGSHIGGWQDPGKKAPKRPGAENIDGMNGEQLRRVQTQGLNPGAGGQ